MTMLKTSRWIWVAGCAMAAWGAAGAAQGQGEFCGTLPAAGFDQAPNSAHRGRYLNPVYGYAVTIPRPLTAYTPAGGPERGFGMVLSWTPRAYLRVDAAYDVYYDITADGIHRRDLNAIRLHDHLLADQPASLNLDHTAAGRYLTRVQCAGDAQVYIHDDVIVVRNREVYRLDLQSVPGRYAGDVKVLEAMLRSWRWLAVKGPYVK
jgi:hypothetical protein